MIDGILIAGINGIIEVRRCKVHLSISSLGKKLFTSNRACVGKQHRHNTRLQPRLHYAYTVGIHRAVQCSTHMMGDACTLHNAQPNIQQ